MKILFVAANPADSATLNLESEITELQRSFGNAAGEAVSAIFLPGLSVEELPEALLDHLPDVLHISAHGTTDSLALANKAGRPIKLGGDALKAFLPFNRPPRLIYLNACDSKGIAKALQDRVELAVGVTAPITNRAARASAVCFYQRLISGSSVQDAFVASERMLSIMEGKAASSLLVHRADVDPSGEILYQPPHLIAEFVEGKFTKDKDGDFEVRFGLAGCPAETTQVVFFTDDGNYIFGEEDYEEEEDYESLEDCLCQVARSLPARGKVWLDEEFSWYVPGDLRLFAVCATGSLKTFSVGGTLCEALETWYKLINKGTIPRPIGTAIAYLRGQDGSGLGIAAKHKKRPEKIRRNNSERTAIKARKRK